MSPSIGAETRVRIAPSVYARAFGEELVLLEFGRGEYFGLDAVGSVVWRGLEQGESLGQIAERLGREWDVTRDDALRDVAELVAQMEREQLVVVTS